MRFDTWKELPTANCLVCRCVRNRRFGKLWFDRFETFFGGAHGGARRNRVADCSETYVGLLFPFDILLEASWMCLVFLISSEPCWFAFLALAGAIRCPNKHAAMYLHSEVVTGCTWVETSGIPRSPSISAESFGDVGRNSWCSQVNVLTGRCSAPKVTENPGGRCSKPSIWIS